ncbi:MAG: hypothetical protein AWU56_2328 [Idiomarina sp. T82-3]|nr:MAG: hypothetical protein AWU56_2328 [Idiomarina sp. T82-3]
MGSILAVHDKGEVVPKSLLPKDEAHWCWLYKQLVMEGNIKPTVGTTTLKERVREIDSYYRTLPKESKPGSPSGPQIARHYNEQYDLYGLKQSDLDWFSNKSVGTEWLYLVWLSVIKSKPRQVQADQNQSIYEVASYLDAEVELSGGLGFQLQAGGDVWVNPDYKDMGLELQPYNREQLTLLVIDFLNLCHAEIDQKRHYIAHIKRIVDAAKQENWLPFIKEAQPKLLDWLWVYLRGTDSKVNSRYRMPGKVSDHLDTFRVERLIAEFSLWGRGVAEKRVIHEKVRSAFQRKTRQVENASTKIRKNFTLSHDTADMLDELCKGEKSQSDFLDRLIREKYREL